MRTALSLATRVTLHDEEELPDVFLWTTRDDPVVPAVHALSLATSLAEARVPVEAHVFRHGRHGLGLADEEPEVAQWTTLAERWLRSLRWC